MPGNSRHLLLLSLLLCLSLAGTSLTASVSQEPDSYSLFLPYVAHDHDPSWHWGETGLIQLQPTPSSDILMVIDHAGRPHLLWGKSATGGDAYIYHTYLSSGNWTSPINVADTLGVSKTLLTPLITPDGKIHLLWANSLTSGGPYRLIYAVFDGSQWSPEEEVASHKYQINIARLNYDENGYIHLTYTLSDIFSYYYHRVRLSDGWSDPQNINPPSGSPALIWRSYRPDRFGGVRYYGEDWNKNMFYSYWRSGELVVDRQAFDGQISSSHYTLLDRSDNLHVYRSGSVPIPGGSVTGLYHHCINANLNSSPEKAITGSESIGAGYSTAWDSQNRLAFGWKPSNTARFNLVVMDECRVIAEKQAVFSGLANPTNWGEMAAVAVTSQPGKFCSLVRILYTSGEYGLLCADINRP
jgi:hypothetical protein